MERVIVDRPGVAIVPQANEVPASGVTWSAILAGAFAAGAVSLILLILGSAFGLVSVSAWPPAGVSATTFGVGAAIWLIVVQWLASGLGGYLTGRLRTKWVGLHTDEVVFRDTAHGFLAWAVATVFAFGLLASAVMSAVSGGTQAATAVLAGSAQGAAQGAMQSGAMPSDPTAYFVDTLFRSDRTVPGDTQDVRAESARILATVVSNGDIAPEDRTYLAQLVAARTGLTQTEAEQRVDQVLFQLKAAELEVRQVADEARKAAATFSFFTCFSLLIGAFIASAAAALGGRHRDDYEARPLPSIS